MRKHTHTHTHTHTAMLVVFGTLIRLRLPRPLPQFLCFAWICRCNCESIMLVWVIFFFFLLFATDKASQVCQESLRISCLFFLLQRKEREKGERERRERKEREGRRGKEREGEREALRLLERNRFHVVVLSQQDLRWTWILWDTLDESDPGLSLSSSLFLSFSLAELFSSVSEYFSRLWESLRIFGDF